MKVSSANKLNFCTIISKNYLANARVLAKSLRKHHPDAGIYVLLVDRLDDYFDPIQEPFELFLIDELPIPQLSSFCFWYQILELNTAVKPYFLRFLLDKFQMQKLVYLDPDIRIYQPMTQLNHALDDVAIVLTPHLFTPYSDKKTPSELDILISGTYNLGFIGLSNKEPAFRLLNWWQEKLYKGCLHHITQGYMVDQKWIDLVPSLFEDFMIFREDTYNVAYWNLHERKLSYFEETLLVNGKPCVFFHFSGFNPEKLSSISKYQNRFSMTALNEGSRAYKQYANELILEGYKECKKWPYAFSFFDNGEIIQPAARELFRELDDKLIKFGNPFKTNHNESFYNHYKKDAIYFEFSLLKGVNLIGMFRSEKGTGEAARCVYRALKESQIPCSLWNYDFPGAKNLEKSDLPFSLNNAFKINLINFNADMPLYQITENADQLFSDRYNIGYWNWELETFPDCWSDSFAYYDEIWVPSSFTQQSIQAKSPIPVIHIPYSINIPKLNESLSRKYFGLNENDLIFLFVFDCNSFIYRKNPQAVIKAFKLTFNNEKNVQLVIKMMGEVHDTKEIDELKELAQGQSNILLVHKVFSREESYALMNVCDVFVSLHRSEGFGLNICEAMLMGKPVIATNYSANTDYMNDSNGYLVNYRKVSIDRDHGPYKKGEKWAEPNIQQAASIMKHIYENRKEAMQKGLEAQKTIRSQLSNKVIGQKIKERVEMIHNRVNELKSGESRVLKEQMNIINYPIKSKKPLIGHGLILMRKVTRWLIRPALEMQSKVNQQQHINFKSLIMKIECLEEEIENLQKMLKLAQSSTEKIADK